ncbi:glycosyltransferase family 2 protein [Liquorilactobacillus vini]|uniref:Glycosyltransferase n=1 Tax=Liquorilactobacillus vini DSM 20605 TaxID=1133569 RepID=A0A0R2CJS2_9LACO|nr:glycosyltransferase [Liquorilactobacillus vini]KRM88508.1 glycosyltransferase [Liquorilactobacillus vini DSM 20605]
MENELVSLILPIFNIKIEFLKKCLTTLQKQTYQNIEIILVDDGSTNDAFALCQKYSLTDKRITAVRQKNQGVSIARNHGLSLAKGNYICFIDPDDWVAESYVAELLNSLKHSQADFVISNCLVVHHDQQKVNNFLDSPETNLMGAQKNKLLYQLIGKKICDYYPPLIAAGVPWGKMFCKSFLTKNKLQFVPGMKRMQDNIFCLYAIENANKIYYLPKALYYYRKDSSSVSLKYSSQIVDYFEKYFDETFKFLRTYRKEELLFKAAYMKELTSFNSFLGRYFFHKNNPDSFHENKLHINKLLSTQRYQRAMDELDYSILTKSEKVFVFSLKHRLLLLLYFLVKFRDKIIF